MRHSCAILIGVLGAAGTLQAATPAQFAGNGSSMPQAQQAEGVKTAAWGFEAPNLFPLVPQQVQSQGGTMRPGPRNRLLAPPHGGPVNVVGRNEMPARE